MGEFKVRSDIDRHRLYITLSGFFREADVEPALANLRAEAAKFDGYFDVVTDLSSFVPGSPAAADALRQGGEIVKEHGRRRAIRVTGGIMTGIMQFKRLLGRVFDEDENVRYATSIEEADRALDNW